MSRLKKYLITHFPLIWNTWAIPVLLINLAMFLIYFIYGYLEAAKDFSDTNSGRENPLIYIIVIVITALVWLRMYNRANAFRSQFPLGVGYLLKEFLLICLIWFTAIASILGIEFGEKAFASKKLFGMDLQQEVANANLALHFIPLEKGDFRVPYYTKERTTENTPLFSYEAFKKLTLNPHYNEKASIYGYDITENETYQDSINAKAQTLLRTKNKIAVQSSIERLIEFAEKLDVNYKLDSKTLAEDCFTSSNSKVPEKYLIATAKAFCYLDVYNLQHQTNKYRELAQIRASSIIRDKNAGIFFLLSVLFAMAIFLSRIASTKSVLLGFVYAGVFIIICTIPAIVGGFNDFGESYVTGGSLFGLFISAAFIFASKDKSWANIFFAFATIAMTIFFTVFIIDTFRNVAEFTILAVVLFLVFSAVFIPLAKHLKAKAYE